MRAGLIGRLALALLSTCVVAAALYWTVLRNDSPQANGTYVELDLARLEDGPAPTHFDTGQLAVSRSAPKPGANLVVREGRLTFTPSNAGVAAAFFATPNMEGSITELGARWVFDPRRNASAGSISLLVSQGMNPNSLDIVPPIPIQFVVTPINWNVSVKMNSASDLVPIAAGSFETPLNVDGETVYETQVSIDGSRVEISLPDGEKRNVNDARVAQWKGNYAAFGLYSSSGADDAVGAFQKIWARSGGRS